MNTAVIESPQLSQVLAGRGVDLSPISSVSMMEQLNSTDEDLIIIITGMSDAERETLRRWASFVVAKKANIKKIITISPDADAWQETREDLGSTDLAVFGSSITLSMLLQALGVDPVDSDSTFSINVDGTVTGSQPTPAPAGAFPVAGSAAVAPQAWTGSPPTGGFPVQQAYPVQPQQPAATTGAFPVAGSAAAPVTGGFSPQEYAASASAPLAPSAASAAQMAFPVQQVYSPQPTPAPAGAFPVAGSAAVAPQAWTGSPPTGGFPVQQAYPVQPQQPAATTGAFPVAGSAAAPVTGGFSPQSPLPAAGYQAAPAAPLVNRPIPSPRTGGRGKVNDLLPWSRVLFVVGTAGGVGKSTLARSIAFEANALGLGYVYLVDVAGDLTEVLGASELENVSGLDRGVTMADVVLGPDNLKRVRGARIPFGFVLAPPADQPRPDVSRWEKVINSLAEGQPGINDYDEQSLIVVDVPAMDDDDPFMSEVLHFGMKDMGAWALVVTDASLKGVGAVPRTVGNYAKLAPGRVIGVMNRVPQGRPRPTDAELLELFQPAKVRAAIPYTDSVVTDEARRQLDHPVFGPVASEIFNIHRGG